MDLRHKNILITGGAGGIGAAMARRFALAGAASIGIADRDLAAASNLAKELAAAHDVETFALHVDVTESDRIKEIVSDFERDAGPLDMMCSNAGAYQPAGAEPSDQSWDLCWAINVMSHVHVSRAVLPGMLARGRGYLLLTCSGAGLLANLDAPYMATKHAAVAYAEWLAICYRKRGLGVSALCPLGVRTPMVSRVGAQDPSAVAGVLAGGDLLEPEVVADCVVQGVAVERFLILPHEQVRERIILKATDRDQWIGSMQRQYGL